MWPVTMLIDICTFISVIYFQRIILSDTLIVGLSGLLWVPQIIANV
jgi:hypothetical protein